MKKNVFKKALTLNNNNNNNNNNDDDDITLLFRCKYD